MATITTLSAEKQREAALREYAANMDRPSAYDGVPRRVPGRRLVTDYGSAMTRWARLRRTKGIMESERPSHSFVVDLLPPAARPTNAVDTIPVQHLHSSLNKVKHPVNVVLWTPDGRRCLTGSMSGEFTLWNGMAFNFELLMQAHDSAVRAATYSHAEDWLLSADNDGVIKYWQPNFNMVKVFQGHDLAIRDLSFSPNDAKFVTACDDASMKIFDFATASESSTITGHSWDVKSVDWHPSKGLVVSGSRDHQVKFWDPRSSRCLTTLHGHKNTVNKVLFEPHRGELLATAARDQAARVFDLRMMRDILLLRGHEKDITTLAWHPIHSNLLTTAGADGAVFHYLLDEPNNPPNTTATLPVYDSPDPINAPSQTIYPAHKIQHAHDYAVQSLSWHPLGHILASCANDRVTRFWTRSRPGENGWTNDRYHIGEAAAEAHGTFSKALEKKRLRDEEDGEMEDEAEGLVDQTMPGKSSLPGLPGLSLNGDGTSVGGAQFPMPVPYMNGNGMPGLNGPPVPMPPHIAGFPAPPFDLANMDPAKFQQLIAEGKIPVPPPHLMPGGVPPMPRNIPIPGMPGNMPIPGMPMQFGQPPAPMPQVPGMGFYPPPQDNMGAMNGMDGVRRRGPLPSQQESLEEEKRRGNYRIAK